MPVAGGIMKLRKMLFRLEGVEDLRKRKSAPWSWCLRGRDIEGQVSLLTSKVGPNEKRWDPVKLVGQTLRLTYHTTASGTLMADLWRPSWAEGEDLSALFDMERTLCLVEQERQELLGAVPRFEVLLCGLRARQRL